MGRHVLNFKTFMKLCKLETKSLGAYIGTTIWAETARLWGVLPAPKGCLQTEARCQKCPPRAAMAGLGSKRG